MQSSRFRGGLELWYVSCAALLRLWRRAAGSASHATLHCVQSAAHPVPLVPLGGRLQALRLGTRGGGSASGALQPLMATEPVGRSRIRSDEVVVPGRAIPRMCHGEEDEEWLAQRDHLVEECERAIDLFVR